MKKNLYVNLILIRLNQELVNIKKKWNNNKLTNTKHFYIDNLLPKKLCKEIYSCFPKKNNYFIKSRSLKESKSSLNKLHNLDKKLLAITLAFQNRKIISLIGKILNIKSLVADPLLYAGGLSIMFKGDFLNPHIDNSHDSKRKKFRRLNLLYYLSPNWSLKNGGNFELWNKQKTKPITIVSKFNRLVIMETNKQSWHSVSMVKSNKPRCCISNYYYSNISPNKKQYFHVTSFAGRPEENIKKKLFIFDNFLRNFFSRITRIGRGKNNVNKKF